MFGYPQGARLTDAATEGGPGAATEPATKVTGSRLSRVPGSVWIVTALWGSLLLGASVLWPMTTGLDETAHINMAYEYSVHPFTFYGPGQLHYTAGVVAVIHMVPTMGGGNHLASAQISPRADRPSLSQLGGARVLPDSVPDQMVQHPPLYYWLDAVVLKVPGVSSLGWDLQIWLMRLVSVVVMLPIPILCWLVASRLMSESSRGIPRAAASRYAVLAAALPLTVPNLIRVGSSVNNDTLLILASSVLLYGLSRVLTGDLGWRTGAGIGTASAVGLWTKGFALAFPVIILAVYSVAFLRLGRTRDNAKKVLEPMAIAAVGCIVGGLWWLRNLIDYHTLQPNGWGTYASVIHGPPDHHGTVVRFVPSFMDQFAMRLWGEVGIPDLPSPGVLIIYGWLALVLIGCIGALLVKGPPSSRLSLAVLSLVPVAYFAIEMEGSYSDFKKWSTHGPDAVQGRYIYGGIAVAGALFAIGWYKLLRPRFHMRLSLLIVAGAILTNAAVWLLILRSWYQPSSNQGYLSGTADGLHSLLRWSPVPSSITILLVVVAPVSTGVASLVAVARLPRSSGDQSDNHPHAASSDAGRGRDRPALVL